MGSMKSNYSVLILTVLALVPYCLCTAVNNHRKPQQGSDSQYHSVSHGFSSSRRLDPLEEEVNPVLWCTDPTYISEWNCDCSGFDSSTGLGEVKDCLHTQECGKCSEPEACMDTTVSATVREDSYDYQVCRSFEIWTLCLEETVEVDGDGMILDESCLFVVEGNEYCCTKLDTTECGAEFCEGALSFDVCVLVAAVCPRLAEKTPSPTVAVVEETNAPSSVPSLSPSTSEPSLSPSTLEPSLSPSTLEPSMSPSTLEPSVSPSTLEPSLSPSTLVPTMVNETVVTDSTPAPTLMDGNGSSINDTIVLDEDLENDGDDDGDGGTVDNAENDLEGTNSSSTMDDIMNGTFIEVFWEENFDCLDSNTTQFPSECGGGTNWNVSSGDWYTLIGTGTLLQLDTPTCSDEWGIMTISIVAGLSCQELVCVMENESVDISCTTEQKRKRQRVLMPENEQENVTLFDDGLLNFVADENVTYYVHIQTMDDETSIIGTDFPFDVEDTGIESPKESPEDNSPTIAPAVPTPTTTEDDGSDDDGSGEADSPTTINGGNADTNTPSPSLKSESANDAVDKIPTLPPSESANNNKRSSVARCYDWTSLVLAMIATGMTTTSIFFP